MMVMMPKRGDLAQPRQLSPCCHPKRSSICCWCCIYLGFVKYIICLKFVIRGWWQFIISNDLSLHLHMYKLYIFSIDIRGEFDLTRMQFNLLLPPSTGPGSLSLRGQSFGHKIDLLFCLPPFASVIRPQCIIYYNRIEETPARMHSIWLSWILMNENSLLASREMICFKEW